MMSSHISSISYPIIHLSIHPSICLSVCRYVNLQIRTDRRGLPHVASPPSSEPNASLASKGDSTQNSDKEDTLLVDMMILFAIFYQLNLSLKHQVMSGCIQ